MNRATRRSPEFKAKFAAYQANQPATLMPVPKDKWPSYQGDGRAIPIEVWRSRNFLVILYVESGDEVRMTVNRAEVNKTGKWSDEITWDELMQCKREIGRGSQWAVELFPPDSDVVNVANMRHLWLLDLLQRSDGTQVRQFDPSPLFSDGQ